MHWWKYESCDCHMHAAGKGRGRQVIAVARTADVILMMLDAGKGDVQRRLLEKELESVGIRLNKKPPNIYFKVLTSPIPGINDDATKTEGILHEV